MCVKGTETIVPTPDWFWNSRAVPERGIRIDSCISGIILLAWSEGLRTLGSCCGHGEVPHSVVLTADVEQIELGRKLLPEFTLYQWQLVDVSKCKMGIND